MNEPGGNSVCGGTPSRGREHDFVIELTMMVQEKRPEYAQDVDKDRAWNAGVLSPIRSDNDAFDIAQEESVFISSAGTEGDWRNKNRRSPANGSGRCPHCCRPASGTKPSNCV